MDIKQVYTGQGENNAIAIGNRAGFSGQVADSIILNASTDGINSTTSGFFVNPVREDGQFGSNLVSYNSTTLPFGTASVGDVDPASVTFSVPNIFYKF